MQWIHLLFWWLPQNTGGTSVDEGSRYHADRISFVLTTFLGVSFSWDFLKNDLSVYSRTEMYLKNARMYPKFVMLFRRIGLVVFHLIAMFRQLGLTAALHVGTSCDELQNTHHVE